MSLSAAGSDLRPSHDPDRLLAGYRSARAQDTLFDLRGGGPGSGTFGGTGYDEFVDATGTIRASWQELGDLIGGPRTAFGEFSHLVRNHCETESVLTGARRFDRRVQRQ